MASTYKVLGQARPGALTDTDLYTNPAGGQAVISSITISNTEGANDTFRIYVRKDGASADKANALSYDLLAQANSTISLTLGVTLDAADVLTVQSNAGSCTFQAFGLEIV